MSANDRQVGGDHYNNKAVQPWDAMEAWMTPSEFQGFLRGNAIKYLARCGDKGGLEDLRKAQHYLEKLIEVTLPDAVRSKEMSRSMADAVEKITTQAVGFSTRHKPPHPPISWVNWNP